MRPSGLPATPSSADFRITDAAYGRTFAIYRCNACGFLQCADAADVLQAYEEMQDPEYEATREPRALQARRLLDVLLARHRGGSLLDIGAGSGILVEAALGRGLRAEGIEPSGWLAARARDRGLPVHHGVLPHAAARGPFDLVTLIDVVEHVTSPVDLLRQAAQVMRPGAVGLAVTPDVTSLAARLMGWRWWHYRAAHVGYFSLATLQTCLRRAGLETLAWSRPTWYFPLDYLVRRGLTYMPRALRPPERLIAPLHRVTVPLNLLDSLLVLFRKA